MAEKLIAQNKKAHFEYFIEEKYETGIALVGCEVKSVRGGNVTLSDCFCFFENGELYLKNAYIAPYEQGSYNNVEPRRDRKLLLHKRELRRLYGKVKEKGFSLVPIRMYFSGSLVKLEIGLGKGKQAFDKKNTIKERDINRTALRELAHLKIK